MTQSERRPPTVPKDGGGTRTDASVGEMYQNHHETVLRYVQRRVECPQVAQDLTGDVFCKAVRMFASYQPVRDTALPWLYTIAAHTVADHYRRQRPTAALGLVPEVASPERGPDEVVVRRDLANRVWAAAGQLPVSQRQALWLRFGEDRDLADIANTMERSVMAVKLLIHRATRGVRARLVPERRPVGLRQRRPGLVGVSAAGPAAGSALGRVAPARVGRWPRPDGRRARRHTLTGA